VQSLYLLNPSATLAEGFGFYALVVFAKASRSADSTWLHNIFECGFGKLIKSRQSADVAQLVEQSIRNRQVIGSSPIVGSSFLTVAILDIPTPPWEDAVRGKQDLLRCCGKKIPCHFAILK
jgi:hypothetical protein